MPAFCIYTNDSAAKSREVVLQVISTLSVPAPLFSSDRLGLCFSYPQGYTQLPDIDAVEIVAPDLPGTDTKGLFWLEISDSYNRTAEKIADQDMTYAVTQQGVPLENIGHWMVTLGGEQAVVLDGMQGKTFSAGCTLCISRLSMSSRSCQPDPRIRQQATRWRLCTLQ